MLAQMLSYPFIVRSMIVGILVSLCASLLGVNLVLKRYSMIGNGLSNIGFGTLAIASALNLAPLTISIPISIIAAFLLLKVSEKSSLKGDASIALVSSGSLAIGVVVISLTTGMNIDICNYMFGSILAMSKSDVFISIVISIVILVLYVLFYNKIFSITFDEDFSKATGVKVNNYNMLVALLTALTVVIGMRLMGALLISSLITFPSLTSMRVFGSFRGVVISSAILSIICFIIGIIISYLFAIPTGASIVVINIIGFILFTIVGKLRRA